jgi:hypothetical protein
MLMKSNTTTKHTEVTMSNKLDNIIGIQWDEYGNPIIIDDEQAMIDYNAMEEESESNDIMEMQNGTK